MKEFHLQFGGKVTKDLKKTYAKSKNWRDGKFQNLVETELDIALSKIPGVLYKQLTKEGQKPKETLPIAAFDKEAFLQSYKQTHFIWYGHSAVLMRMEGKTILIDPMLGPNTTPIAPFATKRFSEGTLELIDHFPDIDLILITHDHYDHLDYDSIQKLKGKTRAYYVALGVKRHLVRWGVSPEIIHEFDWWDQNDFENIRITFTPTRHFSGRGLTDRSKCLWGGWVLTNKSENIWFSGDGGYGSHFKEIGERLGPFDFGFMECGQYNDDWKPIHMFPNEAVQAAIDGNVAKSMPVHWAGFPLSYQHAWQDPANDFVSSAGDKGVDYMLPRLGSLFTYTDIIQDEWWKNFK